MRVHHCAILVLLLSFAIMQQVICDKIYITPSDQPCQAESVMGMQCLTLQQYASSSNLSITTSLNETLMLVEGTHYLWTNFTVSGTSRTAAFEMHGTNVTIYCNHTSNDQGFYIQGLQFTNISGINFSGCMNVNFHSIDVLMIENNEILQHWNQDQYAPSYWILNCILSATIFRMSFCCKSTLQVVWSSLTIEQSIFNIAVAHIIHTNIVIIKSNFKDNKDLSDSVIHVDGGLDLNSIRDCSYTSNSGGNKGGAIYISGNNLSVVISESNFTENDAYIGGAIYAEGFDIHLILIDSIFNGSTASFCGALKVDGLKHNISIIRSIFDSNHEDYLSLHTQFGGGAACINSSVVTILNCTFTRNLGGEQGGVIHIEHSTLYVWKSIFSGNKVKNLDSSDYLNGGVIYSSYSSVNILINESSFIRNEAEHNGGVMYIGMAHSQVRIINSDFDHNCAKGNGQIISIHGSQLDIEEISINTNIAECLCGVISSCKSNVTIIDIQQNFTERADPHHSFCTLYDIKNICHPNNNCDHNKDDDSTDSNSPPPYPSWPDIQSEIPSQTALVVSLTLLSVILFLVLGLTIIGIILYRRGKLKFKKWPHLFVNNHCLYVPMNDTDTSTAKVE